MDKFYIDYSGTLPTEVYWISLFLAIGIIIVKIVLDKMR